MRGYEVINENEPSFISLTNLRLGARTNEAKIKKITTQPQATQDLRLYMAKGDSEIEMLMKISGIIPGCSL